MSYKKNFLTDSIFRIDFLAPEESINNDVTSSIREACAKYFPISEPQNTETQNFSIVANESKDIQTSVQSIKQTEWHFWGKNREKELVIAPNCMFVNTYTYNSFEEFKGQFFEIYHEVQSSYEQIKVNRIGLRYVNQIGGLPAKSTQKSWNSFWMKYINKDLVQNLKFMDDDKALARNMNTIEMNYNDFMLRFVYGIFNQDYPAQNKKQVYILDMDISAVGLFTKDDVSSSMDKFHQKAKAWFDKSITQTLKDIMEES